MNKQEKLDKTKEKMVSDIQWSIIYHEEKLEEFKLKLELINKTKTNENN